MQPSAVACDIRNAVALRHLCGLILTARSIDRREETNVEVGNETLVPEFCILGDMLSAVDGCKQAAITCCKSAWGKFRPPSAPCDQVYSICVMSVILHAEETWAMIVDTLNRV